MPSEPSSLTLPEERYVRQQIVALCELIEMLDAATLAPVEKIAQPLGGRLDGLGVFEEGFLGKEFPNLIHDPFAIAIAILLDCYAHYPQRQAQPACAAWLRPTL
jgi:hypothetical protein